MASLCLATSTTFLLLLLALLHSASSLEFEVGDVNGWVIPSANNSQYYNLWASRKRFIVGDTLHFRYKMDSVMEVSEADYRRCTATAPVFFSNNGSSGVDLDRPGAYYFISGVKDHCEAGQRMIVKVISTTSTSRSPEASITRSTDTNGGTPGAMAAASSLLLMLALPAVVPMI